MTLIHLPSELDQIAGHLIDVDSHEMLPVQEWLTHFGSDVRPLVDAWLANGVTAEKDKNHPNVPGYEGDVQAITEEIVNIKGSAAPGAVSPGRRIEVMDAMGIERQLMFPGSIGLYGTMLLLRAHDRSVFPTITEDRVGLGKKCLSLYQEWMLDFAKFDPRVRPVVPVVEDTVDEVFATAQRLIDRGARAIWLPAGVPVGGVSPAHSSLDPLWAMCADTEVTVTLHLGGDGQLLKSSAWADAEPFSGFEALGEFSVDPYSMATVHLPFEHFLTVMVTGGVFARHPNLRVGVIEVGGHWIGPMMENMDNWQISMGKLNRNPLRLPELPSSYIKNNVRASFFHFEPVDTYLERYDVADVLAFSTDYPHVEGGKDIFNRTYAKIERLGPEIVDKVFRTNGEWLLPA